MISADVASFLGLCQRAREVVAGEFAVEKALRAGKVHLLLLSDDASERTHERFTGLATRNNVPWFQLGGREELGSAIGQPPRVVLAVQSAPMARNLVGRLKQAEAAPEPRG